MMNMSEPEARGPEEHEAVSDNYFLICVSATPEASSLSISAAE